jgi:hypothetical protein
MFALPGVVEGVYFRSQNRFAIPVWHFKQAIVLLLGILKEVAFQIKLDGLC